MASDMEPSDGEEDEEEPAGGMYEESDDDDAPQGRAGFAGFGDDEDEDEDEDEEGKRVAGGTANGKASDEEGEDEDEDEDDENVPMADDDDDGDEEEEEERQVPVPKQKSMTQYFEGAAAKAPMVKRPTVSKSEAPRPPKGGIKASRSSGRGVVGGGRGESSTAGRGKGKGGRTFQMQTASEDEGEGSETDMPTLPGSGPKRKQLELSAADPIEEHERLREAYANGNNNGDHDGNGEIAKEVTPKVADVVKSKVFIVKNDKGAASKRFYTLKHEAVVHAPSFPADPYQVAPGDLLISRKERETELSQWADDNIKRVIKAIVICKVRVDGSGSGSGPGMTNLVAFLHVNPQGSSPQGYVELLEKVGVGETLDEPPEFLVMMDEKLVKRLYKFGKEELPSMYDPNRHGNVKYRVLNKLDEQAKFDDHFKLATAITFAKGRKSKRPAEQSATANGEVRGVVRDVATGEETVVNSLTWHACGFPNVKMAKLKTNGKEKLQLVATSKPNEFLLFRID